MKETSDLEPEVTEDNLHAPGVGQVIDNDTKLVSYGHLDISNEPRLRRLNHEEEFPTCLERTCQLLSQRY